MTMDRGQKQKGTQERAQRSFNKVNRGNNGTYMLWKQRINETEEYIEERDKRNRRKDRQEGGLTKAKYQWK